MKNNLNCMYILFIIYCLKPIKKISPSMDNMIILAFIALMIIYLLITKKFKKSDLFNWEFVILIILFFMYFFNNKLYLQPIVLFIQFYAINVYFKIVNVDKKNFLKFINYTYLIYLFFSILLYLEIIPTTFIENQINLFYNYWHGISIKSFIGFEGSTANIDSYSGLVLLFNLMYNKGKSKYFYIIISFISIYFTFTSTPYIGFIVVALFLLIRKNKKIKKIYVNIIYIMSVFSFTIPYYLSKINVKFYAIFQEFTDGRVLIWNNNIEYMKLQPISKRIFGFGETPLVPIPWNLENRNPHSSFLELLLIMGELIFILYFIKLFFSIIKITDYKSLSIIMYIFVVAIVSRTILLPYGNIIFIVVIYYLINCNNKSQKDRGEI